MENNNSRANLENLDWETKTIELANIQEQDIFAMGYFAAIQQPVTIEFIQKVSKISIPILTDLVTKYNLIIQDGNKICPISIPGLDILKQNQAIVDYFLDDLDLFED